MIILALFLPLLSFASIDAEVGAYSNFIWRGTTFSENRPAIQAELDAGVGNGFYVSTFLSNAEFSDEALGKNATVSSEIDYTAGKRWEYTRGEVQAYYSKFTFPNAGVFDTDEFNLQVTYNGASLELSFMDDYFGYQTQYLYARIGQEWNYKTTVDGALFVGYNKFDRHKGNVRTRGAFETLDGAGNSDYIDIYFVNRKTFENSTFAELAFNWTNRDEYTLESGFISRAKARDFAVIVAWVMPFLI